MDGRAVFKRAVRELAAVSLEILEKCQVPVEQVDWVVPHQANARIIQAVLTRLKLPAERAILTMEQHANTSAASVPLAFAEGVKDGRIQRGQLIMTQAFAAGFAWGANLFRF
jgi:3-oxoacyl-[acyl-carrier-protein] synthase-3